MDSILIPMMTAVIDCNDEEEGNASNINSVDDEDMQIIDSDDEEEEEGNHLLTCLATYMVDQILTRSMLTTTKTTLVLNRSRSRQATNLIESHQLKKKSNFRSWKQSLLL